MSRATKPLSHLLIQPATAILTGSAAAAALLVLGREHPPSAPSPATALLALLLVAVTIVQYKFPVHIWHSVKTYVGSIPLFLLCVLLPVPLAPIAAGLAVTGGDLLIRRERGLWLSTIATDAGRWTLIAALGSLAAHAAGHPAAYHGLPLVGAALALGLGDLLTTPLLFCPISGEGPLQILSMAAREAGLSEAALYLVALLGAVAALQEAWTLALLPLPAAFIHLAFKGTKEMQDETRRLLESMADAVDLRDPYTGGHSRRVTELSRAILQQLGKHGPEADLIISSARVHDIGKIGIPDAILNKAGPLDDKERALMETHPTQGAELLLRYRDFARGVDIVRHHHEAWNGSGYPDGLHGTAIPFGARVIAVADSFDAMTSDRPYRKAMSYQRAASILAEGSGKQWDPEVVDAFLSHLEEQAAAAAQQSDAPMPQLQESLAAV